MPLRFNIPPVGSLSAVSRTLDRLQGTDLGGADTRNWVGIQAASDPRQLLPHKVYSLTLDQLIGGYRLDDAEEVSWRYLVPAPGRMVAAEVQTTGGGADALAEINEGPFAEQTRQILQAASELPEIQDGAYEVRALVVPALYLFAAWLKPAEMGRDDLFIPMAPTHHWVKAANRYTEPELREVLVRAAEERKRFDDSQEDVPPPILAE